METPRPGVAWGGGPGRDRSGCSMPPDARGTGSGRGGEDGRTHFMDEGRRPEAGAATAVAWADRSAKSIDYSALDRRFSRRPRGPRKGVCPASAALVRLSRCALS